jgi:hypothetical protein
MEIVDAVGIQKRAGADVPQDARFVISVLNGEQGPAHERRRFRREPFITPAELEVLGDARPPRCTVFTRDANRWGVGFVTQSVLPIGRDATLRVWVAGEMLMVRSCVLRCREVLPGWFEGAVLFYAEEPRLQTPPGDG